MFKFKYIFICLSMFMWMAQSCVDNTDILNPSPDSSDEVDLSDVPEEIKEGFSVTFQISLDPLGGENLGLTRDDSDDISNAALRARENFVDLEKLRLLFFVCLDTTDTSGKSDIFLFESKSRWVSVLQEEVTYAKWQVTCPIFTYGNNEAYDWDWIQEVLKTQPFKIAVLANRPDKIRYSDFDTNKDAQAQDPGLFQDGEFSFDNKGPLWGLEESEKAKLDYEYASQKGFKEFAQDYNFKGTSVTGLHHCQWDPVYAFKNSKAKDGNDYYKFILQDPDPTAAGIVNKNKNWMGAVSYWTKWKKKSESPGYDYNTEEGTGYYGQWKSDNSSFTKYNWYYWPGADINQGIPMYGIQKFNPLENWVKGTPFNISDKQTGEDGTYVRKVIYLLRSLARVDLIVPKSLGKVNPKMTKIQYSNVFGRCEPMDVATPTEEIWANEHRDNGNVKTRCEWWNIYNYGPIIDKNYGASTNKAAFLNRMAWFYGVWNEWGWNFNGELSHNDTRFTAEAKGMPSPRIFNPCVQRNEFAYLDDVCIEDDHQYHFVIYTGERNINDPSKFTNMNGLNAELAFFVLNLNDRDYIIPLTDYGTNTILKKTEYTSSDNRKASWNYRAGGNSNIDALYKECMALSKEPTDWNWPLMRNHWYTFRITAVGSNKDNSGLDELVISSEDRSTDWIDFY